MNLPTFSEFYSCPVCGLPIPSHQVFMIPWTTCPGCGTTGQKVSDCYHERRIDKQRDRPTRRSDQ
jgi:hypothetical protein